MPALGRHDCLVYHVKSGLLLLRDTSTKATELQRQQQQQQQQLTTGNSDANGESEGDDSNCDQLEIQRRNVRRTRHVLVHVVPLYDRQHAFTC